jgi:hypothetical protein
MSVIKHIKITQEDIDTGERGNPRACPAARAVLRSLGANAGDAVVLGENILIYRDGKGETWNGGQKLSLFVRDFDNGSVAAPAHIELHKVRIPVVS